MPDNDLLDVPSLAITEIVGCRCDLRIATTLSTNLHDALVAPCSIDHRQAFFNRFTNRLLTVDIFASHTRMDSHDRVPVVWCADRNGIDVLTVEDTTVVIGEHRLSLHPLRSACKVVRIDIAQCRTAITNDVTAAHATYADMAINNTVIGPECTLRYIRWEANCRLCRI